MAQALCYGYQLHSTVPRRSQARALTLGLLEKYPLHATDETLPVPLRHFSLMPLEHSEDLGMQRKMMEQVSALVKANNKLFTESAWEHFDVIARFGRFPHRNAVLGRDNTPEEDEYLSAADAKSWGQ